MFVRHFLVAILTASTLKKINKSVRHYCCCLEYKNENRYYVAECLKAQETCGYAYREMERLISDSQTLCTHTYAHTDLHTNLIELNTLLSLYNVCTAKYKVQLLVVQKEKVIRKILNDTPHQE